MDSGVGVERQRGGVAEVLETDAQVTQFARSHRGERPQSAPCGGDAEWV